MRIPRAPREPRRGEQRRGPAARPVRRRLAGCFGLVVICFSSIVPISATVSAAESDAERAAREIQAAREQANAAADAYFQAESNLEVLEDDLIRLELEGERLGAAVDLLRRDVESVAVARFVSSGASGIPLLTGIQAPQDQVQAEVFIDVLTNTGSDILDQYDIAQKELDANEVELGERERDIEAQKVVFTRLQGQAEDEVGSTRARCAGCRRTRQPRRAGTSRGRGSSTSDSRPRSWAPSPDNNYRGAIDDPRRRGSRRCSLRSGCYSRSNRRFHNYRNQSADYGCALKRRRLGRHEWRQNWNRWQRQ
jgi:outer membrane murein-binding lipoprotein Lpp